MWSSTDGFADFAALDVDNECTVKARDAALFITNVGCCSQMNDFGEVVGGGRLLHCRCISSTTDILDKNINSESKVEASSILAALC